MAKKEDNLVKFTKDQSREEAKKNGRKGGIQSGKARRDKKTVKLLLEELMNSDCSKIEAFKSLTEQLGLEGGTSVKKLFTIVTIMNTLKIGTLKDLGTLVELLGENEKENGKGVLEDILKAVGGITND